MNAVEGAEIEDLLSRYPIRDDGNVTILHSSVGARQLVQSWHVCNDVMNDSEA